MIEGITKLMPGTWLEWRDGKVRTESYWTLPEPHAGEDVAGGRDRGARFAAAAIGARAPALRCAAERVVERRTGFVDDPALCVTGIVVAGRRRSRFRSADAASTRAATSRRWSRSTAPNHEELDLNPTDQDLEGAIQEFAYYSDEPSADAGALPLWFLAKLSRPKTEVALSGEGADELFGGYLTYRASRVAQNLRLLPKAALQFGQALMQLWPVSDDKIALEYKIKRMLAGSLMSAERGHVFWNGTFSDSEKRELVAEQLPFALDNMLADLRGQLGRNGNDLNAYLWFDQKYYLRR